MPCLGSPCANGGGTKCAMLRSRMVNLSLDTPELARVYDIRGIRQFEHGKLLIRDLNVAPGHRVLDIGTGTGLLAAHVAELVGPAGQVIGIDPLPLRIEIAKQKAAPNLSFAVGHAEDLSAFAASSFDRVFLNSVFHWIGDKRAVLRQIWRVLKPAGRLGLSSASLEKPHTVELVRERAIASAGLQEQAGVLKGIPHRVSSAELRGLFVETDFDEVSLQIRTFVDYDSSVDEVLEFSKSSSFGNDLASLREDHRQRLRAALDQEFELLRDPRGIRQERHLIFAVAQKPPVAAS